MPKEQSETEYGKTAFRLIFNFTLPLVTTLYDYCCGSNTKTAIRKKMEPELAEAISEEYYQKHGKEINESRLMHEVTEELDSESIKVKENVLYIERAALEGTLVGAGFGMALCHPDGIFDALGITDLPVTNLRDLFHGSGAFADTSFVRKFEDFSVYLLVIAACTLIFKAMFAELANYNLKSASKGTQGNQIKSGRGLAYGFFGDSVNVLFPPKKSGSPKVVKNRNQEKLPSHLKLPRASPYPDRVAVVDSREEIEQYQSSREGLPKDWKEGGNPYSDYLPEDAEEIKESKIEYHADDNLPTTRSRVL